MSRPGFSPDLFHCHARPYLLTYRAAHWRRLSVETLERRWMLTDFYVNMWNDTRFTDNEYTTAVGNDANDGLTPATPRATLKSLLDSYDMTIGDVVYVDTGRYVSNSQITLDATDSGVTIRGPVQYGHVAELSRTTRVAGQAVLRVDRASQVTLEHLGFSGSDIGLHLNDVVTGAQNIVRFNDVFGNTKGILSNVSDPSTEVYGNRILGNETGVVNIYGLIDNEIFDNDIGVSGVVELRENRVFANRIGVEAQSPRLIENNRIFDNEQGMIIGRSGEIVGNRLYGNDIGMTATGDALASYYHFHHNLFYDNASTAIVIQRADRDPVRIENNTVVHRGPQAILLDAEGAVDIRNNIFVLDGHAVAYRGNGSEPLSQTDYNLYQRSGNSAIADVNSALFTDLEEWKSATGSDRHSGQTDALEFVAPGGVDGIQGTSIDALDPPVYFDNSSSVFSRVSGTWAVVNDASAFGGSYLAGVNDGTPLEVQWRLTGLIPGQTYLVSPTWPTPGNEPAIEFRVFEGGRLLGASRYPSGERPDDLIESGIPWEHLTPVTVQGSELIVRARHTNYSQQPGIRVDALRVVRVAGDAGADDDFRVANTSLVVDQGDFYQPAYAEQLPNGNRVNLGAYGDSLESQPSSSPSISLKPLETHRYQVGDVVPLRWSTEGYISETTLGAFNAGGARWEIWSDDSSVRTGGRASYSESVDLSRLSADVPDQVFRTYAYGGFQSPLEYHLSAAPGEYQVRLYFLEVNENAQIGTRKFDIILQGEMVESALDIFAEAGGSGIAIAKQYTATVGDDRQLRLSFGPVTTSSILSGIELIATTAMTDSGIDLQFSLDDGQTWSVLAEDVPLDRFGRGSYDWQIEESHVTSSSTVRVRVAGELASAETRSFWTLPDTTRYYVNVADDTDLSDNEYTTAPGDTSHSGLVPDQPLPSLASVLRDFTFDPGDVIYIDSGAYEVPYTMELGTPHHGITFQGSTGGNHTTSFHSTNSRVSLSQFNLTKASGVTFQNLTFSGGYTAIQIGTDVSGTRVVASAFYDHEYGIYSRGRETIVEASRFERNWTGVRIKNGGAEIFENQFTANEYAILEHDAEIVVSDNLLINNGSAIDASGLIINNEVTGNAQGIRSDGGTIKENLIFGNQTGLVLQGEGAVAENNRVVGNDIGVSLSKGTLTGSRIYSNRVGISTMRSVAGIISHNLIWDNVDAGVFTTGSSQDVFWFQHNTLQQRGGFAFQALDQSPGATYLELKLENNLIEVQGGEVFRDGLPLSSDYNQFSLSEGATMGTYRNLPFVTLEEWQDETGFDLNSFVGNAQFVAPNGADEQIGYTFTSADHPPMVFDDRHETFSILGDGWNMVDQAGGFENRYWIGKLREEPDVARWTLTDMIPGEAIQLFATWPVEAFANYRARFNIYDDGHLIRTVNLDQRVAPKGLVTHGTTWSALGIFIPQSGQVSVEVTAARLDQMIADAILVRRLGEDTGQDDDFHLEVGAPGIDGANPETWAQYEPEPNGNRANLGAYGTTAEATTSSPVIMRFIEPHWNQRYRTGDHVRLAWETIGITEQMPVRLINSGGPTTGAWIQDQGILSNSQELITQEPVSTHLLSRPVPQAVLQSVAWSPFPLAFHAPLAPGQYSLTLYFVELRTHVEPGDFVFDVMLQGETVAQGIDIVRDSGGTAVALSREFSVAITEGQELELELIPGGDRPRVSLAGVAITKLNAFASPEITSQVEVSFDQGASWTTVISEVPMDDLGMVDTAWALDNLNITNRVDALLRIVAGEHILTAPSSFVVAPYSDTFYVNTPDDIDLSDNEYTSAPGSLAHTGLSPDQPLPSIHDVMNLYTLRPSDQSIRVDTGVYHVDDTIVLDSSTSGITITGPIGGGKATLRARDPFHGVVMRIAGADHVTVSHLTFSEGGSGVSMDAEHPSHHIVLRDNTFDDNAWGIRIPPGNTAIEIKNNSFTNNTYAGVESRGLSVAIVDNEFRGGNRGVNVTDATDTVIRNNRISGMRIIAVESSSDVADNEVYDSVVGIQSSASVERNVVYNNDTAIRLLANGEAHNNRVYKNSVGIDAGTYSIVERNRIYSNATGVVLGPTAHYSRVEGNLIYGNTISAVTVSGVGEYTTLRNNTIYQSSAYAIYVESTRRLVVQNNIVTATTGSVYRIQSSLISSFVMDHNLYDVPATNERPIAVYLNQTRGSLSDWQAVSNQDTHSIVGDPRFVDIDGLDGVMGYSNPLGSDYGSDDNFMVAAHSPAIDTAKSLTAPQLDLLGQPRRDDPGATGAPVFGYRINFETTSLFTEKGVPQGWKGGDASWVLPLNFEFPYYDRLYSQVRVSGRGFLQLEGSADSVGSPDNSTTAMLSSVRIAPMWDHLSTFGADDDIFVDSLTDGEVTIRWNATSGNGGGDMNFSVTIAQSGDIRFDYGPGNTAVSPTIGISMVPYYHALLVYDGVTELNGAPSVVFERVPGVADIGAMEFQGESTDETPPEIAGLLPTSVFDEARVMSIDDLVVVFSEVVSGLDALQHSAYDLRSPGPNAIYGDADDAVWELAPAATADATQISLAVAAGALAPGPYRLTVRAIHDLAGNPLDGDRDGSAGGEFVHEFQVYAAGDLDFSGVIDSTDIDLLAARIRQGEAGPDADLNGDGQLNTADHAYLIEQILGTRLGDANLDGRVDATDFAAWNENRFGAQTGWSSGDFNGDGVTDVGDFQLWNRHKFQDQLAAAAVARRVPRAASPDVTGRDAWFSMMDSMAIRNRHRRAPFGVR